jgi:hypothetical protein
MSCRVTTTPFSPCARFARDRLNAHQALLLTVSTVLATLQLLAMRQTHAANKFSQQLPGSRAMRANSKLYLLECADIL